MTNPMRFRRSASHALHGHGAGQHLPERLHAPILAGMKSLVYPSDLADAVDMVGDDFDPVTFELDTLTFADLDHSIIAYVLDPEADFLRHILIEQEGGTPLHAVVAAGSNPMGFLFDDEGAIVYKVYDGSLDLPDGSIAKSAEQVALHSMVFLASDGQSVADLKDAVKAYDESSFQLLFGQ
jgi:hypothetical protein